MESEMAINKPSCIHKIAQDPNEGRKKNTNIGTTKQLQTEKDNKKETLIGTHREFTRKYKNK